MNATIETLYGYTMAEIQEMMMHYKNINMDKIVSENGKMRARIRELQKMLAAKA